MNPILNFFKSVIKYIRTQNHQKVKGIKIYTFCVLAIAFNWLASIYYLQLFNQYINQIYSTEFLIVVMFMRSAIARI